MIFIDVFYGIDILFNNSLSFLYVLSCDVCCNVNVEQRLGSKSVNIVFVVVHSHSEELRSISIKLRMPSSAWVLTKDELYFSVELTRLHQLLCISRKKGIRGVLSVWYRLPYMIMTGKWRHFVSDYHECQSIILQLRTDYL